MFNSDMFITCKDNGTLIQQRIRNINLNLSSNKQDTHDDYINECFNSR